MELAERYYLTFAAAFVRGKLPEVYQKYSTPLAQLSPEELAHIYDLGKEAGLKLHKFKRTMGLPRVQKVLGILKGLQPSEILDIGTGRGVFLWPFLDTFPYTPIQCVDVLDYRVSDLQAVQSGGITQLKAIQANATNLPFKDRAFDIVTALEVIEHIPETEKVFRELCRLARRFIIISVPSKPDDNPEHIHLFDQRIILKLFAEQGVERVRFEYVLGHMAVVGRK